MVKNMKNPLRKRYLRELKADFGKYLIIFVFITGMIGIVSGFLIANKSMQVTLTDAFEKYNIEDGNFILTAQATNEQINSWQQENLKIYENFYIEETTKEVDSTLRIFKNRNEINQICLMEGSLPKYRNEIAIDRLYATNNNLTIKDTITLNNQKYTITGIVTLSDYSALFSNNNELMFDAVKFGVALVTQSSFEQLNQDHLKYCYSWKYNKPVNNNDQAKKRADKFLENLTQTANIQDFIPQYNNQAINFARDDLTGDNSMITVFMYIVIVIIAFVISITITSTINQEATVIGTLRASGYLKKEILIHYIALPILIIFIGAIIGNLAGYTIFKDFFIATYYNSYSMPTYTTIYNSDALIKTTIIPVLIMVVITGLIIAKKLQLSPLQFIKKELKHRGHKKAIYLNPRIKIFNRYRLRIIFQNIPNYLMVFIGIFFANFIILFGFLFNPLLDKYSDDILNNMLASYQYVLKAPVPTTNSKAEQYAVVSLKDVNCQLENEEIMVYGIQNNSNYVTANLINKVYISDSYSNKYHLDIGDTITLKEKYTSSSYQFTIDGIYNYPSSLAVFIDLDSYRDIFELDKTYFNGYFSNEKLTDINDKIIATTITEDDLTKTTRQLKLSMANLMIIFIIFGTLMFILIIYLLNKLIIEKNSKSISLSKILGYTNLELNKLYIITNTIVTILSIFITIPICNYTMKRMCEYIFLDYPQYFPYYVPTITFIKIIALGIIAYTLIAFIQIKKVKAINMNEALKNIE